MQEPKDKDERTETEVARKRTERKRLLPSGSRAEDDTALDLSEGGSFEDDEDVDTLRAPISARPAPATPMKIHTVTILIDSHRPFHYFLETPPKVDEPILHVRPAPIRNKDIIVWNTADDGSLFPLNTITTSNNLVTGIEHYLKIGKNQYQKIPAQSSPEFEHAPIYKRPDGGQPAQEIYIQIGADEESATDTRKFKERAKYTGVHEIIDELDYLMHLLIKKHESYARLLPEKVAGKWDKYLTDIYMQKGRVALLLEKAVMSLSVLEENPALAAGLLNRENELKNPMEGHAYLDAYKTALRHTINAFDRIQDIQHLGQPSPENRAAKPADFAKFIKAKQALHEAKYLSQFRFRHDVDHNEKIAAIEARGAEVLGRNSEVGTHHLKDNIYKEGTNIKKKLNSKDGLQGVEQFQCRYLHPNRRTGAPQVHETTNKASIHSARGKAQEVLRKTWNFLGTFPPTGGVTGVALYYMPIPFGQFGGNVIAGVSGVAGFFGSLLSLSYLTQNAWQKRHRVVNTGDDREIQTPGFDKKTLLKTAMNFLAQRLDLDVPRIPGLGAILSRVPDGDPELQRLIHEMRTIDPRRGSRPDLVAAAKRLALAIKDLLGKFHHEERDRDQAGVREYVAALINIARDAAPEAGPELVPSLGPAVLIEGDRLRDQLLPAAGHVVGAVDRMVEILPRILPTQNVRSNDVSSLEGQQRDREVGLYNVKIKNLNRRLAALGVKDDQDPTYGPLIRAIKQQLDTNFNYTAIRFFAKKFGVEAINLSTLGAALTKLDDLLQRNLAVAPVRVNPAAAPVGSNDVPLGGHQEGGQHSPRGDAPIQTERTPLVRKGPGGRGH